MEAVMEGEGEGELGVQMLERWMDVEEHRREEAGGQGGD